MQTESLQQLRSAMDQLNDELVELLNRRAVVAQSIGHAKQGAAIYVPGREAQILNRIQKMNNGPLPDETLVAIFREVIAGCRNLEQQLRVAYLGPRGTYSEMAAQKHLGSSCVLVPADSLDEVVRLAANGTTHVAVVPVENSTEGAVSRTLDLLLTTDLRICGEVMLPIHHRLLSRADSLQAVTDVAAHPQALAQCRHWLDAHMPTARRVAVASNAEAAVRAAEQPQAAAIASELAAKLYALPVLAANIEDEAHNTTRFLVLAKQDAQPTGSDKTTLVCSVPNTPGSLGKLLAVLAAAGINMTKLESRPAKSGLWEYLFFIDIDGHRDDPAVDEAVAALQEQAAVVKILGSYPKAIV